MWPNSHKKNKPQGIICWPADVSCALWFCLWVSLLIIFGLGGVGFSKGSICFIFLVLMACFTAHLFLVNFVIKSSVSAQSLLAPSQSTFSLPPSCPRYLLFLIVWFSCSVSCEEAKMWTVWVPDDWVEQRSYKDWLNDYNVDEDFHGYVRLFPADICACVCLSVCSGGQNLGRIVICLFLNHLVIVSFSRREFGLPVLLLTWSGSHLHSVAAWLLGVVLSSAAGNVCHGNVLLEYHTSRLVWSSN